MSLGLTSGELAATHRRDLVVAATAARLAREAHGATRGDRRFARPARVHRSSLRSATQPTEL